MTGLVSEWFVPQNENVAHGRTTAPHRRAQAVGAGLRAFADHGVVMAAVQQIADEVGVSQPYLFRLFGSKRGLFLACVDELEHRVRDGFRAAAATAGDRPFDEMGRGFRELVADGVLGGFWLQACATASSDEEVAARCRALLRDVLDDVELLSGAGADEVARFLADGALVVLLQAIGADLSGGSRAAVGALRERVTP